MPDPVVENIPASLPADQVSFFTSLKTSIEFLLGHGRNLEAERALRVKELKNLGIDTDTFFNYSQKDPYPLVASSSESGEVPDAPTGIHMVKGAFSNTIQWTNPTDPIVWYIEIWAAESSQQLSDAHPAGIVTVTDLNRGKTARFIHSGIDVAKDHTYWIRSYSYGQNYSEWHPSLVQGGLTVQADASIAQTIDEVVNVLQGGTPTTYDPGRIYDVDERCRTSDGRVWKSRISLNQGNDPSASPAQWKRAGILMQGDVGGTPTIAIDGNLVVDDTILARHLQAAVIKANHIDTNEVFVGLTIQSQNYVEGQSGWQLNKNGELRLADLESSLKIGNTVDGDYCEITDGDINFYQWLAGTHRVTKSLKRKEEGSGASGSWIYLPGYWGTIPSVDVFAAALPVYNPAYSNQQQKLRCELTDIEEYSPNQYRIRGNNVLELSGSSYQFNAGLQQTVTKHFDTLASTNALSSEVTDMPANTRKVTVDTQFYTQRYIWGCIEVCTWTYISMSVQWRLDYYDGAWKSTTFSPVVVSPWNNYTSYTFTTPATTTNITRIRLYAEVIDFGAYIGNSGPYPISSKLHYDNYYFKINNVTCTLSGASIISTGEIAYRAISE